MRLDGKVVLVVGGGSGMGRAGAAAMAAEGAKVVVSDLSLTRAEAVAASIGENAAAMHVDVTSPELVERVVAETVERFGRLDVLYHCAADVQFVNTQDKRLKPQGRCSQGGAWEQRTAATRNQRSPAARGPGRSVCRTWCGSPVTR